LIKVDSAERARRARLNINMGNLDVTRRGALPVLSDGPLVCTGALENVDLRSEKVCAYMATPQRRL
jgi:hypothetical protein